MIQMFILGEGSFLSKTVPFLRKKHFLKLRARLGWRLHLCFGTAPFHMLYEFQVVYSTCLSIALAGKTLFTNNNWLNQSLHGLGNAHKTVKKRSTSISMFSVTGTTVRQLPSLFFILFILDASDLTTFHLGPVFYRFLCRWGPLQKIVVTTSENPAISSHGSLPRLIIFNACPGWEYVRSQDSSIMALWQPL